VRYPVAVEWICRSIGPTTRRSTKSYTAQIKYHAKNRDKNPRNSRKNAIAEIRNHKKPQILALYIEAKFIANEKRRKNKGNLILVTRTLNQKI
jgi:hypothetical protein